MYICVCTHTYTLCLASLSDIFEYVSLSLLKQLVYSIFWPCSSGLLSSGLVHIWPKLWAPGHHFIQWQPDSNLQQLWRPGGAWHSCILKGRALLGVACRPVWQPPRPRLWSGQSQCGQRYDAGQGRQGLGHVCGQQPQLVHALQLPHQQVRCRALSSCLQ